jgi:transcriptional regulator with XRE-family HTH domain
MIVQTNNTAHERNQTLTIGKKVRDLRKGKALTIKDTALGVGVSTGLISQIENEQVTPAISTLMKIASFLGVDITHFFQAEEKEEIFTVVRGSERSVSYPDLIGAKGDQGYTYESLAYKHARKHMEPVIATFEPRQKKNMVFLSHEGEEFIYILHGAVEFYIEDKSTVLEENDSLYFDSSRPHGYRAVGNRPCKVLAVIYNKRP